MYLFVSLMAIWTSIVSDILQGGRLVTERRMVSDLYVFDLATFNWEKIPDFPEDDVPRPRYFHSADTCECIVP
jgi:hypothetical protein